MAANQNPNLSRFQHSSSFERRPKLLKDFLRNDSFHSYCSTSTLISKKSTVQLLPSKSTNTGNVLLRSRSKRTISALHKMINVVKFFPFASVKSPLLLPSSISRKLSRRGTEGKNGISPDGSVKVKVKDILRWRSFRDLAEEKSEPLDFTSLSPSRSTTTSCSKTSSWCDSDFTAVELPFWPCGENDDFLDENSFLGEITGEKVPTLRNPKGGRKFEELDDLQQSPVSVLENEEYISPFHRSLANIQRKKCNLARRIQEFEALIGFKGESAVVETEDDEEVNGVAKEKAMQLLSRVHETSLAENRLSENDYDIILDFFMHEISTNGKLVKDVEFDSKILRIAKSWMDGVSDECYEWEFEDKRKVFLKDMEKGVEWKNFKQEQEEISKEFEVEIWDELVDDLLKNFSC